MKLSSRSISDPNPLTIIPGQTDVVTPGALPSVSDPAPTTRLVLRVVMVVFYTAAGVVHLAIPSAFLPIVPDWVPFPRIVVLITGACELAGAAGLLTVRLRWWAGVMLALYAVCVFPANIKHAFDNVQIPQLPSSWWYHGPRLLAQPVIVWWALFCAGVIDWPWRSRTSRANDHSQM